MPTTEPNATARAPKGAVVKNPTKTGYVYALRFTAYGKRRYITLGAPEEGWTEHRAEEELLRIRKEVSEGVWSPQELRQEPEAEPTFRQFATEWFDTTQHEWRENTRLDYSWQLTAHLLPFFKDHRLSEITIAEVDKYRNGKLAENRAIEAAAAKGKPRLRPFTDSRGRKHQRRECPLSGASINKTITRLGQILELAVERELIPRNPVKVNAKRRRVKTSRPARTYLDRAEQIEALLDGASALDREAKSNGQIARRQMLATLVFAGLRISELLDLRWRDVDLAAGRLRIREAKTETGVRYVDLLPVLREELATLKARTNGQHLQYVFPSATGTRQDRNRVRNRVLAGAINHANGQLAKDGLVPLPEGLTLHALRRTFASVLVALNNDPTYVMSQMGHTDSSMTFEIYSKVIRPEDRSRLQALVGVHTEAPTRAPSLSTG